MSTPGKTQGIRAIALLALLPVLSVGACVGAKTAWNPNTVELGTYGTTFTLLLGFLLLTYGVRGFLREYQRTQARRMLWGAFLVVALGLPLIVGTCLGWILPSAIGGR
jgi:hypothetical protein